jgi:hypothetical protein
MEPLLEEIKLFCSENNLPAHWAFDPTMWRECIRLHGQVVLDCPLAIIRRPGSARYIKCLTLINAIDSVDRSDKRGFSWDWQFDLSDSQSFVLHYEFP